MGEALIVRKGGGKKSGAYVWKKYNYSTKPSIAANNQDLASDGFYVYNSDDYQVTASDFSLSTLDGGKTVGTSQTIYFTYTDKLYWSYTKGGTDDYQYRVTTNSDNLLIVATNYSCNFTGLTGIEFTEPSIGDFVDFVVSDSESAYPDGGTQDGYYYEKMVEGITGEIITFTPSSNVQSITVQHNLKKAPYAFILIGKNDTSYGIKSAVYPFYGVSYSNTTCVCMANVYTSSSNYSSQINLTTEITDSQITLSTNSSIYYFKSGTEYTIIAIA